MCSPYPPPGAGSRYIRTITPAQARRRLALVIAFGAFLLAGFAAQGFVMYETYKYIHSLPAKKHGK